MGKSTELEEARVAIEAQHAAEGEVCWLDFQRIDGFADFRRQSLDTDGWQRWRQGRGEFTLVVDGMDGGLLRMPSFVSLLHGRLRMNRPGGCASSWSAAPANGPSLVGRRCLGHGRRRREGVCTSFARCGGWMRSEPLKHVGRCRRTTSRVQRSVHKVPSRRRSPCAGSLDQHLGGAVVWIHSIANLSGHRRLDDQSTFCQVLKINLIFR